MRECGERWWAMLGEYVEVFIKTFVSQEGTLPADVYAMAYKQSKQAAVGGY